MMRPLNHITKLICICAILSSCTGMKYNPLHHVNQGTETKAFFDKAKLIPAINVGQELCITVTGLNEESAKYFRTSTEREGATGIECLYYEVDSIGNVTLPLVGPINVAGKSLTEAESHITDELTTLLKEPAVRIEYVDYHISVMGEVALPGVYEFATGQVTLFEAISSAGGLTQFAKRTDVLVIRETPSGVKHIRLNLTKDEVWNTEYYYLHKDDVVMVSSNSGRIAMSNNLPSWGTVLVGLGTVAAIIATRAD